MTSRFLFGGFEMKIRELSGNGDAVLRMYVPENDADQLKIDEMIDSGKMSKPMDMTVKGPVRVEDVLSGEDTGVVGDGVDGSSK